MRILLTGASGFIGRHVLPLIAKEHIVLAPSRTLPDGGQYSTSVIFKQLDLLRAEDSTRMVEQFRPDMLIHLAWYVEPGNFWFSSRNMDWLAASLLLVRAFIDQGGKRMLLAGSCAEYDWRSPMPLREASSSVAPGTLYGICKNSLRETTAAYAAQTGVECLWCRFFWPYGLGEPKEKLLSSIMETIARGQQATCRSPNLKRDYIHVEDAARALSLAAFSSLTGELNIGTGTAHSLGDMAEMAAASMGHPELLKLEESELSSPNPEIVTASTERLVMELGWAPTHSIFEDIQTMSAMFKASREQG